MKKKKNIIIEELDVEGDNKALNSAMQILKEKCPSSAIMLITKDQKKYSIIAYVGKELQSKLSAGNWANEIAILGNGKGGGKSESGQGQANDITKFNDAIIKARSIAQEKLK